MRLVLTLATPLLLASLSIPARADMDSALAAVKEDGPPALDAMWTAAGWLYVGVRDTGQRRDGLAAYYCAILAEHGLTGRYVKIIDIAAAAAKRGFIELGRAECP